MRALSFVFSTRQETRAIEGDYILLTCALFLVFSTRQETRAIEGKPRRGRRGCWRRQEKIYFDNFLINIPFSLKSCSIFL